MTKPLRPATNYATPYVKDERVTFAPTERVANSLSTEPLDLRSIVWASPTRAGSDHSRFLSRGQGC